jgi:2-C-methyl-D-erythritol 4-phosphate cytidylyltransferase
VSTSVGAILVAAGASRRMGFDKLWAPLGSNSVLGHSLATLAHSEPVRQLVLVVAEERLAQARPLAESLPIEVHVCAGGPERRDSVAAGLAHLVGCEWVVVHDAARPFVTPAMVLRGLAAAQTTGAAVAAIPSKDTVKRVAEGVVLETLPREELWNIQTPQVFRVELLRQALRLADRDVTDEATLVERLGGQVQIFPGSESNWKITTPADLNLARALLDLRSSKHQGRFEVVE